LQDFVLHPEQVYGQLFVVSQTDTGMKILEKLDPSDVPLQDQQWQLLTNRYNDA